jgi:hypothetical protein
MVREDERVMAVVKRKWKRRASMRSNISSKLSLSYPALAAPNPLSLYLRGHSSRPHYTDLRYSDSASSPPSFACLSALFAASRFGCQRHAPARLPSLSPAQLTTPTRTSRIRCAEYQHPRPSPHHRHLGHATPESNIPNLDKYLAPPPLGTPDDTFDALDAL